VGTCTDTTGGPAINVVVVRLYKPIAMAIMFLAFISAFKASNMPCH